MKATIEIEIDGQMFSAKDGERVLDVARRNGIFIPALCAHPLLKPYGACRLCLVEIQQGKRKRIVASCAYPAQAGLVVRTATGQISELRRGIMELFLARCPDCPPVRELAHRLGVAKSRFPTLNRADEKCILCGMCVRVCHELVGASAIGFASRGKDRRVDSPFSLGSEDCLGCCACVAVCPTDSIVVRIGADTLMLLPFKTIVKLARCAVCGKPVTPQPLLALVKSRLPFCEWNPLTPSPSLTGGEGARRAGEGDTFGSKNWCPNLCADCKRAQAAQAQAAVAAQRRGKS